MLACQTCYQELPPRVPDSIGFIVWWEWREKAEAIVMDGVKENYDICLNVTKLANHEVSQDAHGGDRPDV